MDDLNNKLDTVIEQVTQVRLIQAKQEENLREHMRRTALQEKTSARLWAAIDAMKQAMDDRFRPIQSLLDRVKFIFAALGALAMLAGVVEAVLKVLEFLK